jgi:putative PIN family toxin of toxin-antitoxin system
MKIVIDANIFVSASIWGGIPNAVIERVDDKLDILFITDEIVAEIERVLRKPKLHRSEERISYTIEHIKKIGQKIIPSQKITAGGSRDKTDNKYLECAVACNADYIISGDIHLLELKRCGGARIVTAREYLEIVSQDVSRR